MHTGTYIAVCVPVRGLLESPDVLLRAAQHLFRPMMFCVRCCYLPLLTSVALYNSPIGPFFNHAACGAVPGKAVCCTDGGRSSRRFRSGTTSAAREEFQAPLLACPKL